MKCIKSCGFIAYKQAENKNYYLTIKSLNGDVGFPKGHMENEESELQTATRELKEETGVEVEVVPGFRRQIEYPLPKVPGAIKQSIYFLGRCTSDHIFLQEAEVAEARFVSYEDALMLLTFEQTRNILKDAESYIQSN